MSIEMIGGGVCAAQGYQAAGVRCGFRQNSEKKDLALIVSDRDCAAAAVYTTNKVKGAPLQVTREHLADGHARAIICNSGNANTCAPGGIEIAEKTCVLTAKAIGCDPEDVIVASTGVIGQELSIDPFMAGIPILADGLARSGQDAAEAIMTTDTRKKEVAVQFQLGGKTCVIGGIAKGSGMIHPNMATMLIFLTSDVAISSALLDKALKADVKGSFNQISVDGDTSTNDMAVLLANGAAGNAEITEEGPDYQDFCKALAQVTQTLSALLAGDGEGASHLIECTVNSADSLENARHIAKTVVSSSLLKAAIYGKDANWGRILCAIGYTDGDFSVDNIDVSLSSENGRVTVCKASKHEPYDEEEATEILSAEDIAIEIEMNSGSESAKAWGCDLTTDYVYINSDYRS